MFTYINDNFLHAPSFDLSRETVKALIHVMLAQAQEIFIEKQTADNTKIGLRAKLAAQAGYLYSQALEGVQENVTRALFEKVWLTMVTVCEQSDSNAGRAHPLTLLSDQNPPLQFHRTVLSGACRRPG